MQVEAPAAANVPAAQGEQEAGLTANFPAGQEVAVKAHDGAAATLYAPAGHAVHMIAPAPLYVPSAHAVWGGKEFAGQKNPAGQGVVVIV